MKKYSVTEQKMIIPDEAVKQRFLERPDIVVLDHSQQEHAWREHKKR